MLKLLENLNQIFIFIEFNKCSPKFPNIGGGEHGLQKILQNFWRTNFELMKILAGKIWKSVSISSEVGRNLRGAPQGAKV